MKKLPLLLILLIPLLAFGQTGTQRSISYLEGRFQKGDKPSQADFYDVFASFVHYTTLSGYQPLDGDLNAIANLSTTGIIVRSAANTMVTRSITAGNGIAITNGDGVSGNIVIGLPNSTITFNDTDSSVGIEGAADYSANYGSLTYVQKTYVDANDITNAAASNEIPKSDGTDLVATGIFSPATGNLSLGGSATTGTTRAIAPDGSSADINLTLYSKGTGSINVTPTGGLVRFSNEGETNLGYLDITIDASTNSITKSAAHGSVPFSITSGPGTASNPDGEDLELIASDAYSSGNNNGGNLILEGGQENGTGTEGSVYARHNTYLFPLDGTVNRFEASGTTFTLTEEHQGGFVYCTNASGCTITVPSGFKPGYTVVIMEDSGAGTATLSGSGTTINGKTATTGDTDRISLLYYKSSETYVGL